MQKMTGAAAILIVVAISDSAARASGAQATPPTKTSAAAFDPCALLTKQDAAAAVGEAVGEPKPIRPGRSGTPGVSVSACEYESAAKHSIQVNVWRFSGDSAGSFVQVYRGECAKKEQMAGVGDMACWYNAEHRELQVLKGATLLTFEIKRSGNATEALATVARKALARLP